MTELLESRVTQAEGWMHLRTTASSLWAAQEARIALTNRVAASERHGGSANDIMVPAVEALASTERALLHDLVATMKEVVPPGVPVWISNVRGIGEPSIARLLGEIGHPRMATPVRWDRSGKTGAPVPGTPYIRTVSQLWQYCGVGDPQLRLKKGISQEELLRLGKPRAKQLVYLISEAAMKTSRGEGPYRAIYDDARERYAERVHARDCPQCKTKVGGPWKAGHQHAAALRKVGKEILKDLWIASK